MGLGTLQDALSQRRAQGRQESVHGAKGAPVKNGSKVEALIGAGYLIAGVAMLSSFLLGAGAPMSAEWLLAGAGAAVHPVWSFLTTSWRQAPLLCILIVAAGSAWLGYSCRRMGRSAKAE